MWWVKGEEEKDSSKIKFPCPWTNFFRSCSSASSLSHELPGGAYFTDHYAVISGYHTKELKMALSKDLSWKGEKMC